MNPHQEYFTFLKCKIDSLEHTAPDDMRQFLIAYLSEVTAAYTKLKQRSNEYFKLPPDEQ